jgi:ketosteroid isomerase-like protein
MMPTRAVPRLDNPEQAVLAANLRFYLAFQALDIEQMDDVWLHEDWVECVHPGWDLLLGWEEVRESWARIFAGTQRMKVDLSSVWVRVEGDVAWVACTEHVTSTFERGFDQALVQATNIFVRRPAPAEASSEAGGEGSGSRWQMVAHHASPLPSSQTPTLQ